MTRKLEMNGILVGQSRDMELIGCIENMDVGALDVSMPTKNNIISNLKKGCMNL